MASNKKSKSEKPKNIGFFEAMRIATGRDDASDSYSNQPVRRGARHGANVTVYSGMFDGRSY